MSTALSFDYSFLLYILKLLEFFVGGIMSSEQDSKTVVTSSGEPEREVKVGTHKNLRLQGTRWIPTAPGIFMARDGRFRGGSFPIDVLEQDGKLIAILPFNVHSVSACNNG